MSNEKALLGKKAESLAINFLRERNYKIIAQNYSTKFGELDIVATDKNYLCFVEVRSKSSSCFGFPEESLTEKKKRHIRLAAMDFIKANNLKDPVCRFDVVCIQFDKNQNPSSIKIERDAIC